MNRMLTFMFIFSLFYAQKENALTILVHEQESTINKFEKHFIESVVLLYNRKNNEQMRIKYQFIKKYQTHFDIIAKADSTELICSLDAISRTKGRLRKFTLSEAYLPAKTVVFGLNSTFFDADSISWKSKGIKVGFVKGSRFAHFKYFWHEYYDSKMVFLDHRHDYIKALKTRKVNFIVDDELIALSDTTLKTVHHFNPVILTNYALLYPRNSILKKMFDPFIKYVRHSKLYYNRISATFSIEGKQFVKNYFVNIYNPKKKKQTKKFLKLQNLIKSNELNK